DGNGSRTKQTDSGVITNYVYNLENRLSEIRDGSNSLIASYRYDPFGKRISKTVGGNTTYYYYSEDGLVAEADSSGVVTTSYHYQLKTPWGTDPMFIRQGGVYGFYVTDHLGTPQRVVGSNGAVLWGAVYDAFGEAGIVTASLVSNLRFPGQYYDAESGLHYNYWRYYDSGVGGYVTSDPIGLRGGVNAYSYAIQNPGNMIDPVG
ncbi:MAG: type IV secretion protein Rhs, partial [Gammaproteobacteria bacterium]|nr:type IV secretion protein Rhs [Gammaproteobacteria bacterium]